MLQNAFIEKIKEKAHGKKWRTKFFTLRKTKLSTLPTQNLKPGRVRIFWPHKFKKGFYSDPKIPVLNELVQGLEELRMGNGAFIAAPSEDYKACWIRDQLYATLTYYYLGDCEKFRQGIQIVFAILENSRGKIETAICEPPTTAAYGIHAKFHAETLHEITEDWGHHQIDALGLFLFMVALARKSGIEILRGREDAQLLQHIVSYLASVKYWRSPDNGMWEEGQELHASSIGAAVAGLKAVKETDLAVVPAELISRGLEQLYQLLPNESPNRGEDLAQLSLIWPYNLLERDLSDVVIKRVISHLTQEKGLNRYLGDNYYRSEDGVSAEWPMGFFWLSIIFAERGETKSAREWLQRGLNTLTPYSRIPELYQNGKPNEHTPLAWAHALATIAFLANYCE